MAQTHSNANLLARAATAETCHARAMLRIWNGSNGGSWHFLSLSGDAAEAIAAHAAIRRLEEGRARGFGSVKLVVTIGESRWATSVFPQRDGSWFLPVKAAIRHAEDLREGDTVGLTLALL